MEARAWQRTIIDGLDAMDPGAVARLSRLSSRLMGHEALSLDPLPRILGEKEWALLTAGAAQRLRIWNAFLADIHDGREVLRAGILPPEWIHADPAFRRAAVRLPVPGGCHVTVMVLDLARDRQGRPMVDGERFDGTHGAGRALQARSVWKRLYAHLVPDLSLPSARSWPPVLLRRLQARAVDGACRPQVVLLSPGPSPDHARLARRMGIRRVEPEDLAVIDSRVRLKTVAGLEPVDVILRQLEDRNLDPLEFPADPGQGIPGLMMCLRKETVSLCNAPGSGLAGNRLVAAHLHRLSRFYLGEELLLPSADRHSCRCPDVLEMVLSRPEDFIVRPIRGGGPLENPARELAGRPGAFVAATRPVPETLPVRTSAGWESRPGTLRLFVIDGREADVLALTRYAPGSGPDSRGGIKDTWVLADPGGEPPPPLVPHRERLTLISRHAGHFLWMGRYLDRAGNTLRGVHAIRRMQEEWPAHDRILDRVLHRSAGIPAPDAPLPPDQVLLLDPRREGSLIFSLRRGCENGMSLREILPPGAVARISQLADLSLSPGSPGGTEESLMLHLDALTGTLITDLLRDERWHFWRLGVSLERALHTLGVLRQLLRATLEDRLPRSVAAAALVHLLARGDAPEGRSLWQGNLRSLLQDTAQPRSVAASLTGIREGLAAIPHRDHDAIDTCRRILARLEFPGQEEDLLPWLDARLAETRSLASLIADRCLHHPGFIH